MTVDFPTFLTGHEPSSEEFGALLPIFVKKTADESVTSSTTMQDDDKLSVSVLASATYTVELFLIYDGAGAQGLKVGFSGPTGATLDWVTGGLAGTNTTSVGSPYFGESSISTTNTYGAAGAGSKLICRPSGLLVVSTTAGTFKLQWAQGTSSGTATRVFAGSWMLLRRVA